MVELNDFTQDEIVELSKFLEFHVHNSVLNRVYVLSENPIEKASNFCIIFRIFQSCINYASTIELKDKIKALIDENIDVFNEIFPVVSQYQNLNVEFGKARLLSQVSGVFFNPDKNKKINKIIDALLVFGEKIELNKIKEYMGVDLETDFGKEAMKEIRKEIEKSNL